MLIVKEAETSGNARPPPPDRPFTRQRTHKLHSAPGNRRCASERGEGGQAINVNAMKRHMALFSGIRRVPYQRDSQSM